MLTQAQLIQVSFRDALKSLKGQNHWASRKLNELTEDGTVTIVNSANANVDTGVVIPLVWSIKEDDDFVNLPEEEKISLTACRVENLILSHDDYLLEKSQEFGGLVVPRDDMYKLGNVHPIFNDRKEMIGYGVMLSTACRGV